MGLQPAIFVAGAFLFGSMLRHLTFGLTFGDWSLLGYVEALCRLDCGWYESISSRGYDSFVGESGHPYRATWAFFPLYPLLVSLIGKPLGLAAPVAGFIVSNLCILATAVVSRPLFGDRERFYWLWVFGLLVGPFSFLFSALYTESLFILLTMLTLVSLSRQNYLAAGLSAGLLSATRVTGVVMSVAMLVQMLVDHRRGGGKLLEFPARLWREPQLLVALALAPTGLACFMIFLHFHAGDAFAFAHIQRGWERSLDLPFLTLFEALTRPVTTGYYDLLRISGALAATAGLLLVLFLFWTGRVAAAVFCALALLVSLAGGIGSLVRFTAGLAPLGFALADMLSRRWWIAVPAGAIGALLGGIIALGWFNGSWFVM